jgi:hypothetical protein
MKALAEDFDGVATRLAAGPYAEPALVPAIRPAEGPLPGPPLLTVDGPGAAFAPAAGSAAPWLWVVRTRVGDRWESACLPGRLRAYTPLAAVEEILVSAVARDGREGPAARLPMAAKSGAP